MSLHKQSDVKNHLSPRYRTKIHLCKPVLGAVPASTAPVTGSTSPQATIASK